ncbi:hypothetical protein [Pedobacter sp. Leaf132]|uniref:hypothetical protein n=1 Tax=Pedobacter sp. Leaf132 TaxID=2876557 RepID=UPI001E35CE7A|nr:hypothetical protein [Pedobacter sp. Leaf132]
MILFSSIRTKAGSLTNILPDNQTEDPFLQSDCIDNKKFNQNIADSDLEDFMNDYEALAFYVTQGIKPEWLPLNATFEPSKILLDLHNNYASLFADFIQSIKNNCDFLERAIKLIDRHTYSFNHSFRTEISNSSGFTEINHDWLFLLASDGLAETNQPLAKSDY